MSKESLYVVELERVSDVVLQRALDKMMQELSLEQIFTPTFEIYDRKKIAVKGVCVKIPGLLYPVDIYTDENNKLVINGDEMDVKRAVGKIKQFYEGMEFSIKYNSPMVYNEKNDEVELLLETRLWQK